MSSISQATQRLGWDLLSNVSDLNHPKTATALSPTSIVVVLAMLAGAADSGKRAAICDKLGVQDSTTLPTLLSDALIRLGPKTADAMVTLANAAFVDKTVDIFPAYAEFLGALSASVKQYPSLAGAVEDINGWISDNTRGRISNMLSEALLLHSHVVLANALYFKGTWATKFDPDKTKRNHPFHLGNNQKTEVDMMFLRDQKAKTAKGNGFSAVCLPYTNGSQGSPVSLVGYLPDEGVSLSRVAEEIARGPPLSFQSKKLARLGFPKFEIERQFSILSELQEIGFDVEGDYSELGTGQTQLGAVVHKTFLKVNEEGTEAAAATTAVMTRSIPTRPLESLVFDRPFLFSIGADDTGMPIMCGVFSES